MTVADPRVTASVGLVELVLDARTVELGSQASGWSMSSSTSPAVGSSSTSVAVRGGKERCSSSVAATC